MMIDSPDSVHNYITLGFLALAIGRNYVQTSNRVTATTYWALAQG